MPRCSACATAAASPTTSRAIRAARQFSISTACTARAWRFRLAEIIIPIQLRDGEQNALVPPAHAQYLARAIPNAHLTICPGEGHLLIVDHMAEIIQGIVA